MFHHGSDVLITRNDHLLPQFREGFLLTCRQVQTVGIDVLTRGQQMHQAGD